MAVMSKQDTRAGQDAVEPVGRRRSALERLVPHWPLVVTLAVVAAGVLWWASYSVAR
jgi:hypothetical protein